VLFLSHVSKFQVSISNQATAVPSHILSNSLISLLFDVIYRTSAERFIT
jgi:hypothetical protein